MKKINTDSFNTDAQVVCACGATFTTGSVKKTIQVDICSKCHPFYTGEMKYVDTQGRVEKFVTRRDKAAQITQKAKKARAKNQSSQEQKTLKQMLQKKS